MDNPGQAPQFATAEFDDRPPDTRGLLVRGIAFGMGGALLGIVLYSAVGIITGYAIGLVSLAVGYIVGHAVLMGSRGRTGRKYQVAAVLLTYAAVSISAVPVAISQLLKEDTATATAATATPAPPSTSVLAPAESSELQAEATQVSIVSAIGVLIVLGLASPFLELANLPGGLIGLLILGIGMQIAWRITGDNRASVQAALTPSPEAEEKPTSLNLHS